ncbi:hypothetical protein NP233_g6848 [Leucocoprinus birnbaumii]|uniref:Dol-P-Man:Man(5)GlcNAc(2)-PP-Dol alpha-1,3-mannosyltransferase n=1 Tax=Leucocoprinus birnbaumii TaxID=56174 RepID=A0AAD5VRE6_9AGAR|nr:hypothetical protein NP233_g6848 [Leucocoprinus birnbaumii]
MAHNTSTITRNVVSLVNLVQSVLFDRKYFWTLASLVIIGDALVTELIIKVIPYTEIDWETYMVQTQLYVKGQHDYSQISGPTGPLVYPAGHVRIHEFLYHFTDAGRDVRLAQHIYGTLYIFTLIATCAIYRKAGNVPNWVVMLLPLSKRLHSIFVLRLFNDCWAVFFMTLAVLTFQLELDDTAILLYSGALSVKMSILLYLPGILVITFKRKGIASTFRYLLTITAIQALLASPFLAKDPWSYLKGAFDLGRVFLYKWTVNWRFVDEPTFLSPTFSLSLLIGHLSVLVAFGFFKWCAPDGGIWKVLDRGLRRPLSPAGLAPTTPDYTLFGLEDQIPDCYETEFAAMAKKKAAPTPDSKTASVPTTSVVFPELSLKEELECRTILEDQILVIDEFLSPAECKAFSRFIDSLPLELTPPKKRGEAERVNYRFSVTSLDFAQKLHKLLTPHLPSFPYPTSSKKINTDELRYPHSFNSNIRVYKYGAGHPHYDDSVKDPLTGAKSEWTLLIYLTGAEDGVEGGETIFYKEVKGQPREEVVPPLTRGTALLHRHGQECMLHEGSLVKSGTKYVLRSDLMFMR